MDEALDDQTGGLSFARQVHISKQEPLGRRVMGLGTSLFLIAVGAILDFAVNVRTTGFNINTVGVILMIVGAIGLVLSLLFWNSWGGFHTRETVVERPGARRRTVVDDEVV
jgi:uncharacterized protein DUF6458